MKPLKPNNNIPPRVEKRISKGCRLVCLPTKIGLKKLSIIMITKIPNKSKVRPCQICPLINKIMLAGNQIRLDPIGKIDNIINIPIEELESRVGELSKFKDKEIAVICRSGNRSNTGMRILRENGFNAKNVLGGMIEYRK